ncbi:MAG: beta-propeller domain-containing protein, partial [Baekduiaceae bacterium]
MRRLLAGLITITLVPAAAPPAVAAPARLPAFSSCTDLVGFARRNLDRPAVPTRAAGSIAGLSPRAPLSEPAPQPPSDVTTAMPVTAQPDAGEAKEEYSTTNVQEAGIDEPDLVKTDGRRLFVVAGATLRAYDVTGDVPKTLGTLDLEGSGGEILLRGDRILLVGATAARAVAATVVAPAPSDTRLVEIDVRDASAMKIARTMTVPGSAVSARLTGGTARVVLASPASLAGDVSSPALSAFVPRTTLRSRITKRTYRRALVPCRNVRHPRAYAGNDLLTVLSVDLDQGLFDVDRDAILAGAQVVYASERSLYVASQRSVRMTADGG